MTNTEKSLKQRKQTVLVIKTMPILNNRQETKCHVSILATKVIINRSYDFISTYIYTVSTVVLIFLK